MLVYVMRRFGAMLPTVFLLTVGIFLMVHLIPGDPVVAMLGEDASQERVETMRRQLGLDAPLPVQYVRWLGDVLRGDLGLSVSSRRPVSEMILSRLPVTGTLAALATLFSILVAVPAGVIAAVNRGRFVDQAILFASLVGISVPSFVVAIVLMLVFSVQLGWFPVVSFVAPSTDFLASLRSLTLPAISLAALYAAILTRMTRSGMADVLGQDFVRTARAKGVRSTVVLLKHALRNALIPIVTIVGINLLHLLSGSIVIETVFSIPGIGRLVVTAIFNRDYTVVQGSILAIAAMFLLINLFIDLTYARLDPRIRYD